MGKIMDALEKKAPGKHVPGLGINDEIARTYFHAQTKRTADLRALCVGAARECLCAISCLLTGAYHP